MKKIIILSVIFLLAGLTLHAQQTLYVIDNETVEHFDGSQLKGRIIRDYRISTTGTGKKALTVHSITTAPFSVTTNINIDSLATRYGHIVDSLKQSHSRPLRASLGKVSFFSSDGKAIVYVVDGEVYRDAASLSSILPGDIRSIRVLKNGSEEQLKYGEDCRVIVVETRKSEKK